MDTDGRRNGPPAAVALPEDLEEVLGRLARGLEDMYGDRYGGLVLYGSYARGEAREGSDVDLLVLLGGERGGADRVERTKEVLRMEPVVWPLSLESGYVLSVLPVGAGDFSRAGEPFLRNAREEGIVRG